MNRRVLLTGAAGDIGSAVSRQLSSRGYSVIGIDKNRADAPISYQEFFAIDLTDHVKLLDVCHQIRLKQGPLWGIVHCAGVYPIVGLSTYTDGLWDEVQDVNIKSAFRIVRELEDTIVDGGRIVFVSSGAAHLGSGDVAYSTSKAGLVGLGRGLAKVFADKGILVNSVCPGLISSQMSARMTPEHAEKTRIAIPLNRAGTPEEVAVCVSFLLDPQNTYMTGSTIDVNGGLYMR